MYATVKQTIESIVREKETALATELRVMEDTLEREQNASDLAALEAGYRRAHPLRSRFAGVPGDLAAAAPERALRALDRIRAASDDISQRLAPVFRGRALSRANVAELHRIAQLDWDASVYREMDALLGNAPETPPLAHPLYPQWMQAAAEADALPRIDAPYPWYLSDVAGWASFGGFFASAAALVAGVTIYQQIPTPVTMSLFGLFAVLALSHATARDRPTRFATWPEDLADRCVSLGAYAEAARLVQWHSDGTLSHDDIDALNRCLDVREVMGASVYATAADETAITAMPSAAARSRLHRRQSLQGLSGH
ncbi:hypothetical protein [Dolichospermum phage Dfl-JY45]